jgi:hypothetical protein
MSTYSINANLENLTIAQRDSFVDMVQGLGPNKLESMNIREVGTGTVTFSVNANLKLLTSANAQTVITNITSAGSDKIIALNVRKVTE